MHTHTQTCTHTHPTPSILVGDFVIWHLSNLGIYFAESLLLETEAEFSVFVAQNIK